MLFEQIYRKQYRPPASTYRRPPFEPVTLADADFSVSPRPSSIQLRSSPANSSAGSDVERSALVNENSPVERDENESSLDSNITLSKIGKELKPDLIESNADLCSTLNEFNRIERRVPDVASANIESEEDTCDFKLSNDSDELECVENVDDTLEGSSRSKSTDFGKEVISFVIKDDDVTESELHQYLEELEQGEFGGEQIPSKDSTRETNSDENNKISIKVESQSSAYLDQSEIKVEEATNTKVDATSNESSEERTTLHLNTCTGDVTTYVVTESDPSVDIEIKTNVLSIENCVNDENDVNSKDSTQESAYTSETEVSSVDFDETARSESFENDLITNSDSEMANDPKYGDSTISTDLDEELDESNPFREARIDPTVEQFDQHSSGQIVETEAKRSDDENLLEHEMSADMSSNIRSSDTNYNILDSKTAISTFDSINEGETNSSRTQRTDSDDEQSECSVGIEPKLKRPDSLNLAFTTQPTEMSSTSAGTKLPRNLCSRCESNIRLLNVRVSKLQILARCSALKNANWVSDNRFGYRTRNRPCVCIAK